MKRSKEGPWGQVKKNKEFGKVRAPIDSQTGQGSCIRIKSGCRCSVK